MKLNTQKGAAMAWIAGAIVVLGLVGIIIMSRTTKDVTPGQAEILKVKDTDWQVGPVDAAVTLIEYSDFQCPACKQYYPVLKQLETDFPTSLRFVYRHFPLPGHPNAPVAARAAEAAGNQGKFWEMHDKLFDGQEEWSKDPDPRARFGVYAGELGLDLQKFAKDLLETETQSKVNTSTREGMALGVNSTPTFYLNGEKIENPRSFEAFKELIQSKITPPTPITPTTN